MFGIITILGGVSEGKQLQLIPAHHSPHIDIVLQTQF